MLHKNQYLRLADHLSEKSSAAIHRNPSAKVSQNSLAPNSDQIGGLLTLHDKPIGGSCVIDFGATNAMENSSALDNFLTSSVGQRS